MRVRLGILPYTVHIVALSCIGLAVGQEQLLSKPSALRVQALEESLVPIRPGLPGKSPFWNAYAKRFIYAPGFDFKAVDGAISYRFTATSVTDERDYVFVTAKPWAPLTSIWKDLPVGQVHLKIEGLDDEGKSVGAAATRDFYRAALFKGHYHEPTADYRESACRALAFLFRQGHFQRWLSEKNPDPAYELYCYPSKIIGAVIESMTLYAGITAPPDADDALRIAQNAADYLISVSEAPGTPLEFFFPTYAGSARTAGKYADQLMLVYPAKVGDVYLDLYERTKGARFFEAAKNIADTYVKLQLPSGTWPLKVDAKTGRPVTENLCVPIVIFDFLDRLATKYQLAEYRDSSRSAMRWIMENPVKTFNWEGQFEDTEPSVPYKNLTRGQACLVAIHLLGRHQENPQFIDQAEEILRFVEDQFVVWERPMPQEGRRTDQWITPCVLEQYHYYVPIDASAAICIEAYQKAYEVTGKEIQLAKALALANTMVMAQDKDTGRYPTYWERNERGRRAGWINCATHDAKVMLNLGRMLSDIE